MTRQPGQPTGRSLAARDVYLSLGPGRSLQRCLNALKRRGQVGGKPPVCTRLKTLEEWSSAQNWQEAAAAYDAEQALRRAREQRQQERLQAIEDIKLVQQTLRGAAATAAIILSSYTDKSGQLTRQGELRDVAILLKVVLEGLHLVNPAGAAGGLSSASEIEQALRLASPAQRSRALEALHELQSIVNQVEGRS